MGDADHAADSRPMKRKTHLLLAFAALLPPAAALAVGQPDCASKPGGCPKVPVSQEGVIVYNGKSYTPAEYECEDANLCKLMMLSAKSRGDLDTAQLIYNNVAETHPDFISEHVTGLGGKPTGKTLGDYAKEYGVLTGELEHGPEVKPATPDTENANNNVQPEVSQNQSPPGPQLQVSPQVLENPTVAAQTLSVQAQQEPGNAQVLTDLSAARLLSGDTAGAQDAAKRALALDPKNDLARMILGHPDELIQARSKLGGLKNPFDQKAADKGAVDLRSASDPAARQKAATALAASAAGIGLDAAPKDKAQALIQSALQKLSLGDVKGALFDLSRALLNDPGNARARVLRAHISNLADIHNYGAAKKDAEEALKLDPKNAAALFEKGYAELQLGKTADALRDIEDGLALDPNSGMGRLYHAMALERTGLFAKAIEEYQRAAALDPALKPLVDEALARLISTAAPHGRLPRSVPLKPILLTLLGLTAFALIFEGAKRVLYKDWKTTAVAKPDVERPATGTLAPGAMLAGTFRIERELARGGIGIVYQATDVTLKRTVAVKHLNREAYESAAVREKFLKEAQLAAKLSHPNLAQIFSVVGDGELYLVFEFVEGETLHQRLSRKIKLPLAEIKQIMREVAEAVDYAHAHNIIHRDLKPANIMMTADGHYKVLDFGIAHETRNMSDVTMTQAWGTPPYMAPEQEMGTVRKESDLYALGVMLYELVVGQRPFDGAGMLEKKLHGEFIPIKRANPDASAALQPFFVKVLSADPSKRYSSAQEMYRALAAIEDTPVRAA